MRLGDELLEQRAGAVAVVIQALGEDVAYECMQAAYDAGDLLAGYESLLGDARLERCGVVIARRKADGA